MLSSCDNSKRLDHNGATDSGNSSNSVSCLVLYTEYERMALERIVGPKRCAHILSSKKTTFMFC